MIEFSRVDCETRQLCKVYVQQDFVLTQNSLSSNNFDIIVLEKLCCRNEI